MLDLELLKGKTLLITGGTGMIGKWMVSFLQANVNCRIIVTGRDEAKVRDRLGEHVGFIKWDISHDHLPEISESIDYIIHLASNTHPVAYASDPISTIVMNVSAAKELMDLAVAKSVKRFVYASSVEIYGKNRGDVDLFREDYCGDIDSNTLRAGYPESKRCGESLCQAFLKQYDLNVVIPRIARVYGPTLLESDTKALSQFIRNALKGEDIVLKSEGRQYFSYLHVADAVSGILTVMLKGEKGSAYNISDSKSDITLRDLAFLVASKVGRKVIFDVPTAVESSGFSPAMFARMDSSKLAALGWSAEYTIARGISDTIDQLSGLYA